MSCATAVTLPSGSTRRSAAVATGAPPIRSKPKLPTYARPCASTTMSFGWPPTCSPRSAWVDQRAVGLAAQQPASRIDTTSSRPSGSQPRPEGCAGTSASVRRSEPSSSRGEHPVGVEVDEPDPALVPARALGEGQPVHHRGDLAAHGVFPSVAAARNRSSSPATSGPHGWNTISVTPCAASSSIPSRISVGGAAEGHVPEHRVTTRVPRRPVGLVQLDAVPDVHGEVALVPGVRSTTSIHSPPPGRLRTASGPPNS